jgi:hypothetical protein
MRTRVHKVSNGRIFQIIGTSRQNSHATDTRSRFLVVVILDRFLASLKDVTSYSLKELEVYFYKSRADEHWPTSNIASETTKRMHQKKPTMHFSTRA